MNLGFEVVPNPNPNQYAFDWIRLFAIFISISFDELFFFFCLSTISLFPLTNIGNKFDECRYKVPQKRIMGRNRPDSKLYDLIDSFATKMFIIIIVYALYTFQVCQVRRVIITKKTYIFVNNYFLHFNFRSDLSLYD